MEDLANWIYDLPDICIALGNIAVFESLGPNKHALQDVDDLNFQLRVRDLLINRKENVQNVRLLLFVVEVVELRSQNPQQNHKQRPTSTVTFYTVFLVVLFSSCQSIRLDQLNSNLHVLRQHFLESALCKWRQLIDSI